MGNQAGRHDTVLSKTYSNILNDEDTAIMSTGNDAEVLREVKKRTSSENYEDENDSVLQTLLGFNPHSVFENKANQYNVEAKKKLIDEPIEEAKKIGTKMSKSTSDHVVDHRVKANNRKDMRPNHIENRYKAADVEKFIEDASQSSDNKISYGEYQRLFKLMLQSDEEIVIKTLREFKKQSGLPQTQIEEFPPTTANLQESEIKVEPVSTIKQSTVDVSKLKSSDKKSINVGSRSKSSVKKKKGKKAATANQTKLLTTKETINTLKKVPRTPQKDLVVKDDIKGSIKPSALFNIQESKFAQSRAPATRGLITVNAFEEQKKGLAQKQTDKLSVSSASSVSVKSMRSLSLAHKKSPIPLKKKKLRKFVKAEKESDSDSEIISKDHYEASASGKDTDSEKNKRGKLSERRELNKRLDKDLQTVSENNGKQPRSSSPTSLKKYEIEVPLQVEKETVLKTRTDDNQEITSDDCLARDMNFDRENQAKLDEQKDGDESGEEEQINVGVYDQSKYNNFSEYSKLIDRQQRASKLASNSRWMDMPCPWKGTSVSKFTQHLKIDDFKSLINLATDITITKVTDTRIYLKNDSMNIIVNKEKLIDSIFTLNRNESSTEDSSGNCDAKIPTALLRDEPNPQVSYYPFNPSFETSEKLALKDPNDKFLQSIDQNEQRMIMEMIENSLKQSKSVINPSPVCMLSSCGMTKAIKSSELKPIVEKELPAVIEEPHLESSSEIDPTPKMSQQSPPIITKVGPSIPLLKLPLKTTKLTHEVKVSDFDSDFFNMDVPAQKVDQAVPNTTKAKDTVSSPMMACDETPAGMQKSCAFNFDGLEDMGEIIDIGFEDDIDPNAYLNTFTPSTNKIEKPKHKSPVKSQDIEIVEEKDSMPGANIHSDGFILPSLNSNDLILKESKGDSLALSFKKTKSHNILNSELTFGGPSSIEILNHQQKDQILMHLLKERGCYEEKLRLAQNEIHMRQDRIEKMKNGESYSAINMGEVGVHLAFLFSSPLIRRTKVSIENIMQLDYLTEINDILKVCSRRKYELKYKTDVATVSNLRSTITDCPVALHFSGHGLENTHDNLGTDFSLFKDKGNILLLEDEHGMADYFYEEDLKYMVQISQNTFEVVFVSSCYSQFAGEVFLNAGAKHVICIKSGERISDKASLRFSRVFYETLFVKNYNVCSAFDIAKEEINKVINASEANKFKLLIQGKDNTDGNTTDREHKCYALGNFSQGELTNIDKMPIFDAIPSNVDCFLGRQQDMYEIINLLDYHRLVSILGPPGIGKTSLARNLANYLKDRKKFSDGIIYVGLRGCESAQMFLTRLCLLIRSACSLEEYKKYGLEELDKKSNTNNDEEGIGKDDESKYRNFILNMLREREVLLILDNAEDPLEDDTTRFVHELDNIIDNCSKLKFLVTTRKTINKLAHNHEKPYILQPLSKEASLKLLITKAPRDIKNQELQDLLRCSIPKRCKISQSLNVKLNSSQYDKFTLLEHPFTALLGGHPQAISLAAPLLEYKSLKNLFYAFCDSNLMDAIDYRIDNKDPNTSLRVSLELSINHMKNTVPDALNLFSFIGLLPGGVSDDEITTMWGNTQWMTLKDSLLRASLLVYKTDPSGKFIYSMLPFMSIRSYELLEQNEERRHKYHMKCCQLFKDYCYDIFYSDMSINQVKQLVEMETNIWACIYRSLNRKKNIRYENDDVNGTNSDYFLSDYEKSVERLSVSRVFGKRYREEEDHKMEKLIEQDNESSSDESNDMSFSSLLNSKNQDVHRGTERNYKSHFRISLKNNQEEEKEQDDTSSKCDTSRKKPKRRTKVRRITDVEQQKQTKFFDEELLVIYYATTLIMINKQQDALKAVSEYLQKRGISELASANLYKIYAVLLMMNKNCSHEDIVTAVKYFKKAGQLFYSVGCKKGLGLCKLGLAKIHHQYVPELLLEMKDKNEDMMLEASLNFAQNALKLFKQISYATGEYHSDLLEAGLKKKTNNQERGFKATQHYIELSKRAQKEKTELRQISWVTSEYVLLLEIVLDDVSHLAPEEQHQIKKINGTLVSVLAKNSKKHTRNSSKLENFQNLTTNLKPSTLAIEDKVDSPRDTNTKLNQKRKSVHKPKPSSKNAAEVSKSTITVKLQSYQPQTPFKESRSKGAKMPEQAQPKISVKNTLSKDESKKDLKMWKI